MTKKKFSLKSFLLNNTIYIIFIVLLLVITIIKPSFFTWQSLRPLLYQSATRLVMALGVMWVILSGGADLSGGRILGFAAVLSGFLMQTSDYPTKQFAWLDAPPIIVAMLITILFAAIFGLMNGVVVAVFRVPAFIGTLGIQLVAYGTNLLFYAIPPNNSQPIGSFVEPYKNLGTGSIFGSNGLPYILLIALGLAIICHIVLSYTRFGKNLFAMGGNIEAARVSGIKTARTQIIVYIIAAAFYGLSGFLEAARNNAANTTVGLSYEFDAIASCVVGGVSIAGGVGAVPGVIIGVLIFNTIAFGMTFIGINPNWQFVVKGIILIAAVGLDVQKYVRRR